MAELDDELECVGGCVLLFGCANWHYPYHGGGGGLSFCDEMSLFPRRGRYDAIELLLFVSVSVYAEGQWYVYVIVIELFSFISQGGWGLWCGWWVNTCVGKGAMGMGLVVGITHGVRRGGYIHKT